MRRIVLRAFAMLLCLLALPATASAVQVSLLDATVMHTDAGGAFVYENLPGGLPTDLTQPTDFANGTVYHRVTVSAVGANTTSMQFCFVQTDRDPANRACTNYADVQFNANGVYESNQAMSTLDQYANIDWTATLAEFAVIASDANGYPVDASNTMWDGSPDFTLYYPLTARVEAVLVASGDQFEGYPSDNTPTMVETPTFNPPAGSYADSVTVTIASATANAEIRYTLDGSDPDMNSTLYENPITITDTSTLKAIGYLMGSDPSTIASADYTITVPTNGLRGRYYNGREFNELRHSRTDARLDFEWADGEEPAPNTQANNFSIIWSGTVEPLYSETYTFKTINGDGVRVWVNDTLIIDDWNFHGAQERSGNISLQAGQQYDIWIEYFNGGGAGTMQLYWLSSTQPEEIIPDSQTTPTPQNTSPAVSLLMNEDDQLIAETISEPIQIEARRRGGLGRTVRVELQFGGTATNGEDYEELPAYIDIPEGELSATLDIQPIIDGLVEEDETIEISIREGGNYTTSEPSSQTITLQDFDVDTFALAGEVVYTGTESGKIYVEAFTEFDQEYQKRRAILLDPGAFAIIDVTEGEYQVVAFIDTNDNERLDNDELWVTLKDEAGEVLRVMPPVTDIVLNLDNASRGNIPGPANPDDEDDDGGCATAASQGSHIPAAVVLFGFALLGLRRRRTA